MCCTPLWRNGSALGFEPKGCGFDPHQWLMIFFVAFLLLALRMHVVWVNQQSIYHNQVNLSIKHYHVSMRDTHQSRKMLPKHVAFNFRTSSAVTQPIQQQTHTRETCGHDTPHPFRVVVATDLESQAMVVSCPRISQIPLAGLFSCLRSSGHWWFAP
jgi:hypothetical protein